MKPVTVKALVNAAMSGHPKALKYYQLYREKRITIEGVRKKLVLDNMYFTK